MLPNSNKIFDEVWLEKILCSARANFARLAEVSAKT
jgi:hypothetical protein